MDGRQRPHPTSKRWRRSRFAWSRQAFHEQPAAATRRSGPGRAASAGRATPSASPRPRLSPGRDRAGSAERRRRAGDRGGRHAKRHDPPSRRFTALAHRRPSAPAGRRGRAHDRWEGDPGRIVPSWRSQATDPAWPRRVRTAGDGVGARAARSPSAGSSRRRPVPIVGRSVLAGRLARGRPPSIGLVQGASFAVAVGAPFEDEPVVRRGVRGRPRIADDVADLDGRADRGEPIRGHPWARPGARRRRRPDKQTSPDCLLHQEPAAVKVRTPPASIRVRHRRLEISPSSCSPDATCSRARSGHPRVVSKQVTVV